MRRGVIALLVVGVLVAAGAIGAVLAFDGDGDKTQKDEAIQVTPPSGSISSFGFSTGATAEPIARLPGVTVVGSGDVEVKPDTALVRLTIGSGSAFSSDGGPVKLVDEHELDPVLKALADAGVSKDDIYVNTFNGSFGPNEGAAVVALEWTHPREVKKLLAIAQRAVRNGTPYNLQDITVVFRRKDCDDPERSAMRAALADAQTREKRLASLSHMKLGRLIAVSEATTSAGALAAFTSQSCGVGDVLTPGLFEYQASAGTADKLTVSATLEVTFAVER
jgi:uncharacterized protein YggE